MTPRVRHELFDFDRSLCHLRVFEGGADEPLRVIATDVEENSGQSITNAVEGLAAAIDARVARGRQFDLVLCHPVFEVPGGSVSYCRVTFLEASRYSGPEWHHMDARQVESHLAVGPLPDPLYTVDERLRLAGMRERDEAEAAAILAQERASMQVVALQDLPAPRVDLDEYYLAADWPAIARASEDILCAGVDPLDRDAVGLEVQRCLLAEQDRSWLFSLFRDPIVVSLEVSQYINGRHRTEAMLRAGVERCVIHVEPGYELP